MFGAIVVGTDGSDSATAAVGRASTLARQLGCPVHLVSAYEPGVGALAPLKGAPADVLYDAREGLRRSEVDQVLEHAAELVCAGGSEVRLHARQGEPARAILEVAREESAELIIVGNRGMTGVRRFLLGSVPNTISHHATCDVMIVRTTG